MNLVKEEEHSGQENRMKKGDSHGSMSQAWWHGLGQAKIKGKKGTVMITERGFKGLWSYMP